MHSLSSAAEPERQHDCSWLCLQALKTYQLGGKLSELLYSPATLHGLDLSSAAVKPRARAKPMLAVCHNVLYVYGGLVEVGLPMGQLCSAHASPWDDKDLADCCCAAHQVSGTSQLEHPQHLPSGSQ